MDAQQAHELALIYAKVKLNELQVEKREAFARGNVDMSNEEIQYLKSAYNFAIERLI